MSDFVTTKTNSLLTVAVKCKTKRWEFVIPHNVLLFLSVWDFLDKKDIIQI